MCREPACHPVLANLRNMHCPLSSPSCSSTHGTPWQNSSSPPWQNPPRPLHYYSPEDWQTMLSSPFATQQQQQQQQPQPQGWPDSPVSPQVQVPQLTTPREQQQPSQQQACTPALPWVRQHSPARQQTPAKPHSPPVPSGLHAADLDTPLGPKAPQSKRLDAAFSAGMPQCRRPARQLLLEMLRDSMLCSSTLSSPPLLGTSQTLQHASGRSWALQLHGRHTWHAGWAAVKL